MCDVPDTGRAIRFPSFIPAPRDQDNISSGNTYISISVIEITFLQTLSLADPFAYWTSIQSDAAEEKASLAADLPALKALVVAPE